MTEIFDYIVVGGGSGGCAVASRLSEHSDTRVALLEAGGRNDNWVVTTPGALILMVSGKVNNWNFQTVPQAGLGGRIGYQPRGRGLGGSSAINAMVYIRGHRADYDHWAELGNTGWSYDDVLPYFKRSEDNEELDGAYHGKGGPLHVGGLRSDNPVQEIFLQAAREAQFRINDDFNGEEQEGLGVYQVTQKNGERWSAARGYVHPFMGRRQNLHVETGALVTRLLFEGKRAVGVEYRRGKEVRILRARREIILGLGAFQTPQLLMLSGIGDGAALARQGIAVEHHLPGVGQNLQDHPDFVFGFASDNPNFTGLSWAGIQRIFKGIAQYRRERRGPMTSNVAECGGFLKTRPDLAMPDIQLHFCMAMVDDHGRKPRWGAGFSCHVCLLRPESRGSVWLQSADPAQAPAIDPNFLGEAADMEAMVAGFKTTRRLLETPALRALQTADMFTADVRSDDDIRAVLRRRVDTVYHPVGTCKMGVNDPLAVVDPALRVYGVEGLRIADASVMPTLIGGNTNAPTIMIGEKAADMIRAAALS
ncbi:GMC family oxidoreductase N-terminal domain-containing protein [Bradyrhizobium sp. U87765 SZCCT0131]|uniref:GMC family oxidoreductase n=1 Tax=unclassified Bradyrhizobium TaxID=2631580 RepID=UPI001BAA1375|nr:GMC family oxidoreductase N-terminal domain-containing protein [Bradyrhizobium sp. U87765 SZCCT0131]MBR1260507.1 GMC family oxidoreductase N-terminal domain-containing protein [Bradyrhizobium sp. U87765 SZCCT0134]MBR1304045.1 GMC family oxidoreductase N-terminal domain-containing protein [Bradyrhizobium sp. U87765 SZCCT0110]MBR1319651.1 GMC family oxidoreductase N-terminal domain-containing protein [Bradyrhizobium sp. U87765 SZCCT0109]MBR1347976.1 GMC family oxidoreductase N-terminal domain-